VVQLTDAHLFADPAGTLLGLRTRDSLRHVIAQVRREQPCIDLLLCTGDLSQDGSAASYQAFRDLTGDFAVPARWLPGNHDEARVMAEVAREVIVLAESDKIGRRIPNLELPWSDIHTLITDEHLSEAARSSIQARGVKLICAAVETHQET
jgi:hypothetical protein